MEKPIGMDLNRDSRKCPIRRFFDIICVPWCKGLKTHHFCSGPTETNPVVRRRHSTSNTKVTHQGLPNKGNPERQRKTIRGSQEDMNVSNSTGALNRIWNQTQRQEGKN